MELLDLFVVASMPVLKVLLLTALGSFLALQRIHVLGDDARKQINRVVFFVFGPALTATSLAKTITSESVRILWFMPVSMLFSYIIGSALGWLLIKITKPAKHLKGVIIGCCSAGNTGYLLLILIPAFCKERNSPFGSADVCNTTGTAYASLSLAIGALYMWSYVYNIVRISSKDVNKDVNNDDSDVKASMSDVKTSDAYELLLPVKQPEVCFSDKLKEWLKVIVRKLNLKQVLAPSTIAAIVGFIIGIVPQIRNALVGAAAPLHIIQDSASLLGDAATPTVTLIVGGNLLRGLKGSGIRSPVVVGILAVKYIFLPLCGIAIVKGAVHYGLVNSDPLYQFILLLQFAVPSAMNVGIMTQLFGVGERECSVILMWAYVVAPISLTLWSTLFMWLVA